MRGFVDVARALLEYPPIVRLQLILLVISACLLGCASDAPRPVDPAVDLSSPDGTRRSHAVQAVAASGDRDYVPELIPMLDDPDETVRLQAHAVLMELTGHDTGYRPFADRVERSEHVRRWETWWAAQTTGAQSGASTTRPAVGGDQP